MKKYWKVIQQNTINSLPVVFFLYFPSFLHLAFIIFVIRREKKCVHMYVYMCFALVKTKVFKLFLDHYFCLFSGYRIFAFLFLFSSTYIIFLFVSLCSFCLFLATVHFFFI